MTVELVDGRAGKPHIDGDDLGDFKLGFCGGGYVLGTGDVLKATQPSANKVTVATGSAVMPLTGRHVRVTAPETVAVTSGTQGQKRRDIVVLRASTGSGVESASLVCLRGTPVSYGTPADPAVPEGDLALYRVTLDGASVSKPEPVFKVLRSAADLEELWDSVSHVEVSDGWTVERLPSGYARLHAATTRYMALDQQWGDYHVYGMWPQLTFPVAFAEPPVVTASCEAFGGCFAMPEHVAETTTEFRIVNVARDPEDKDVTLHVSVFGRLA